jgi:hypothetical protein
MMKSKLETLRESIQTMKAINDVMITLGTALLILTASSLIFAPHPDVFRLEVPDDVRIIFLSVTALIALSNVTGVPKQVFWNDFGTAFYFPFAVENPQQMAGWMESTGIGLTLMGYPAMRGVGYALLMILHGRGAMVHAQLGGYSKMTMAAVVSLAAGLLLKDEFFTVF